MVDQTSQSSDCASFLVVSVLQSLASLACWQVLRDCVDIFLLPTSGLTGNTISSLLFIARKIIRATATIDVIVFRSLDGTQETQHSGRHCFRPMVTVRVLKVKSTGIDTLSWKFYFARHDCFQLELASPVDRNVLVSWG